MAASTFSLLPPKDTTKVPNGSPPTISTLPKMMLLPSDGFSRQEWLPDRRID